MNTKRKKTGRKLLSFLLTLAMVFSTLTGIMPGTWLTAYAADDYSNLKNTTKVVKFDSKECFSFGKCLAVSRYLLQMPSC